MISNNLFVIILVCLLSDFSDGHDYTYIEAINSFYKIHPIPQTWLDAKRECAQEGASLFYPENVDEQIAVMSFLNSTQPDIKWVFVGISDIMSEGEYETIDGKPISEVYINWKSDEPNNSKGDEDCVEQDNAGKMNDCKCSNKFSFICKKSPLSLDQNNSYSNSNNNNKDGQKDEEFFRKDYTYIEAVNSFYKIHPIPQTWFDAKLECAQEGASLFYPDNEDEQNAVMSFQNTTQPDIKWVYLGISDIMSEGVFETIDGKATSEVYINWKLNEPNDNSGDEDCVEQDNTGKMNDCKCSKKFSFICKKSSMSLEQNSNKKDGQKDEEFFRKDYTYIEAVNSFYKIHPIPQTWFDAKRECAQEGASLFYPDNEDEQNAVMSFQNTTQPDIKWVYLGISDIMSEGVFETIDGKATSEVYINWKLNEPNDNSGDEDCVEQDNTGKMNDCKCSKKFSFICKKSSMSLEQNSNKKDGQKDEEFFRKDYTYIEAVNSFYKIHPIPQTWFDAKRECAQEGASLFYPDNEDEQNAVMSFQNTTQPDIKWVYLGISDIMSEGVFETIDGKATSEVYINWKLNEPNDNSGDEDCVEQDNTGKMNDCKCSKKFSFICKMSLSKWNNICNIDYSFNKYIGKCYKLHETPLTWTGAYLACRAEQSHLAVISNWLEATNLAKFTESATKQRIGGDNQLLRGIYHLGFHYRFKEGWQTVKGTPFTVDDDVWWDNHQPIIDEREQCGSMFYNGLLNNIACDTKSFFICEHEVESSSSMLSEEMFP